LKLKQRRLAAHWKPLIIAVAVVAAGLAIALPVSMASTHHTASPVAAEPGRAQHNISGAVALATADPAAHRPTPPSAGCHVAYTSTDWPGQFTAKVTITNRSTTRINRWRLSFTFPGDEAISSAWNATFTQTGARVSAMYTNYDDTIPPGGRQSLGFLGAWTSNDTAPTGFSVNGTACN
jgi:cellulase/cellobiase CelA1